MVVFPAASRPTIKILISFFPHSLSNNFEIERPMTAVVVDLRLDVRVLSSSTSGVYYLVEEADVSLFTNAI